MAANPKPPIATHYYHAEAHVLSGHLKHPIEQPIEHHGHVIIDNTRREHHITETIGETTLEGLVSFKSGHTRVSGTMLKNKKDLWGNDHSGWVTLSTSVLEGLNVFEVITADRMVAQVSTEHSQEYGNNHVPKVTFLGTRFENLQVSGYPVELELDFGICGPKPPDDRSYLEDRGFLDRVQRQFESIAGARGVPEVLERQYGARIAYVDELKKQSNGCANGERNGYPKLQCSLVKSIKRIPIPGVETYGNIIFIPDFGTVSLAEVEVGVEARHNTFIESKPGSQKNHGDSNYFILDMLNMRLGCIGGGEVKAGSAKTNGQTAP